MKAARQRVQLTFDLQFSVCPVESNVNSGRVRSILQQQIQSITM